MTCDLLTYQELQEKLPGLVSVRRLCALSRAGEFADYIRLTPRGPPLWSEAGVDRWFDSKFEGLDADEEAGEP